MTTKDSNTVKDKPQTVDAAVTANRKEPIKKSVSFSNQVQESAANPAAAPATKKYRRKPRNPNRKTSLGKFNPSDLIVFLVIFGTIFLVSILTSGRQPEGKTTSLIESLEKMMKIALEEKSKKERLDCDLFLYRSQIPYPSAAHGNSISIFAAKEYQPGDIILNFGRSLLPLTATENNNNNSDTENPVTTIWVPPLVLTLKHHPTFFNVQASPGLWTAMENSSDENNDNDIMSMVTLKADKTIPAGHELILDPKTLPPQLLKVLKSPSLYDYEQADIVIQEMADTLIPQSHNNNNNNNNNNSGKKKKAKGRKHFNRKAVPSSKPTDVNKAMEISKKLTSKFISPTVAALLPNHEQTLPRYLEDGATSVTIAVNPIVNTHHLAMNGQCLLDAQQKVDRNDGEDDSSSLLVASKIISKDSKIMPLPLYMLSLDNKDTSSSSDCSSTASSSIIEKFVYDNCLGRSKETSLLVCPLGIAPQNIADNDIHDHGGQQQNVNAKYQWSEKWARVHGPDHDPSTILKEYPIADLGWDLIAIRDIQPGEPIVVSLEREEGMMQIPNDLLPDVWKDSNAME